MAIAARFASFRGEKGAVNAGLRLGWKNSFYDGFVVCREWWNDTAENSMFVNQCKLVSTIV